MGLSTRGLLLGLTLLLAPAVARAEKVKGDVTLLFVGGAGGDTSSPTLGRLKTRLESLDPKSGWVVFTGNYSQAELPGEGEPGRAQIELQILAHVGATADFVKRGGKVYFLAGQSDFAAGGSQAVRRLRKFLNHAFRDADADEAELDVMPVASCGDPLLLELGDNVGLVLVNSQWWMQDWANDPRANEGCEVKSRAEFHGRLQEVLGSYRSRRLVIASHHPLRSYGERGGAFSASAHLSPAPVLGTAWVLARQAGLVEQYQNHPMVRSYLDLMLAESQRYGASVFASGHDASLQFLAIEHQTQLVSGTSGRSALPTTTAAEGDFAAASPGWAELVIEPSGAGEAQLISGDDGKVLYQAALPALVPPGIATTSAPSEVPPGPVMSTYTRAHVWQMGSVMKFFVGSFYSDAYSLELPYDVLNLESEQGGLTAKGIGGGLQTNSLKLVDSEGGEWSARGVTKDSSRFLPWPQNQATAINRLLDHGYTATHPEAALSISRLAEAVGVLHSEPRLLYLPDQARLGHYRGFLTDEVVLFEQKPKLPHKGGLPETLVGAPSDEGKLHFRTTQETIDKVLDKPGKHHVDQEAMLRARLLDIFVGDWDRHEGQWRFVEAPNADGTKTYRPIGRDRDQVFANYNGLGLFLARIAVPEARKLQPFGPSYGSLVWLNFNARDIDPSLLNQIPHTRWREIAAEVAAALTDAVIDEALLTWHPAAYVLDGARIGADLKQRRDKLVDAADEFFALVNHDADVTGSSGADRFDLWFEASGAIRVAIRKEKGGEDAVAYFDRVFEPDETRELRIYALEGDDRLVVHGDASTSIVVRFVGGPGNDTVVAAAGSATTPLNARAIRFYDSEDGATIDPSISVRDQRSSVAQLNQYDRNENHDPNSGFFFPGLVVNPDDGVWLGGTYTYTVQGYKKHPYAARHEIGATFATATLGASLKYRGLFPQSADWLDQQVDVVARTPTYTRNFYGFTNRYGGDTEAADYYRVRQALVEARYGVSHAFLGDRTRAGAQLLGQAIVTEATAGRFVTVSTDVTPASLGARYFAGARVFAETNTFDDLQLPTRGIALHGSAEGRYDVAHGNQFSVTYKAAGAVAIPFDRQRRFVLITRAAVEGITGEHPFYFSPTLGGSDLRAYHTQQLAGDVAFSQTTDLRIDVFRIYSGLPGTIGLNLSVDHGRVFGPTIPGKYYHLNYGGGLWWSVLDVIGVSFNYFRGLDGGSRFVFAVGPLFSQTGF